MYVVLCLDSIDRVALQKEVIIVEKKRKRYFILAVMTVSPYFDREFGSECEYEGQNGFGFFSLDQGLTCDTMGKRI